MIKKYIFCMYFFFWYLLFAFNYIYDIIINEGR